METRRDGVGAPVRVSADIPSLLLFGGAGVSAFFAAYQLLETYVLAPRISMEVVHLLHMIRGIMASLLLAAFVAWHIVRHQTIVPRFNGSNGAFLDHAEWNAGHLRWFINMRWIAAGFGLALIVIAVPLTGLLSAQHLPQLLICWTALVVGNVIFVRLLRRGRDFDQQVIAQSVLDLVVLTGMLNASGGIENPLSIAYLFHVIIAGILLPKRKAIGVALFGNAMFCLLALGELFQILPHATILLFPHSHTMVAGHMHITHAAHDPVFVSGRVVSFVAVMLLTAFFTTLVTDRLRQSEADLEVSARKAMMERRRLEGVIDAAGLGMVIIGSDQRVDWMNQRLATWFGWPDSIVGSPWPHDHREGSGCVACIAADALHREEQSEVEIALPGKSGGTRFFRDVTSPVCDTDGRVVQVVGVVEEVTARKVLEAEALHAGRLSVLGQLAAGVAHEIGNPLSSLHARLQLMKRHHEPEFHLESLNVLQTQIDRIGRIVRNVSHLARSRSEAWMSIDVNAVVAEAVSLVKLDERAGNIQFSERLQEEILPVYGMREQLLQVFINLLLNAVEAMAGGGTLETTTSADDHGVRILVSDSGSGIDETVRPHLFEPFFTTKREGTGLGLSISYSLVHAHGGTISVTSEPGRGSRFTVDLPAGRRRGADIRTREVCK
ncbi:MAG TPA: ATP-binding protein [Thermoanaerobaculia bacterium]